MMVCGKQNSVPAKLNSCGYSSGLYIKWSDLPSSDIPIKLR